MSEKIAPCPYCGKDKWEDVDWDLVISRVECLVCGLTMRRDHLEELVK